MMRTHADEEEVLLVAAHVEHVYEAQHPTDEEEVLWGQTVTADLQHPTILEEEPGPGRIKTTSHPKK